MLLTLYLANNDEHLKYFTEFFERNDMYADFSECFFGACIEFECQEAFVRDISSAVSCFIIEFYFKEAILSKIYDEYINFDIEDAAMVLTGLTGKITDTDMHSRIRSILIEYGCIYIDSFIIFNMKSVMQNIYENVDVLAEKVILQKERDEFVAMIRTYCTLNTGKCRDVMVEFSEEMLCRVKLDNTTVETSDFEKLLVILTEYSPEKIILKNSGKCPSVSTFIKDVFRDKVSEK